MLKTIAVSVIALAGASTSAHAALGVLFDSQGFEAPTYALGNLTGQNGWTQDVGTAVIATVQDSFAQSGTQAVKLIGGATGTNWFYPSIGYAPQPGEIISVKADIARTLSATASFGYLIDVYGQSNRIARFGLGTSGGAIRAIFTTNTGTFLGNATVYNSQQWVNFEIQINFATSTYDLFIDSVPTVANIPFATAGQTLFGDADLQVSTAAAATDMGWFDNYRVEVIPAPGAAALLGLGGLVALRRRR